MWLKWESWALLAAVLAATTVFVISKRSGRSRVVRGCLNCLAGLLALVSLLFLVTSAYLRSWYSGRNTPDDRQLGAGVRHLRISLEQPRAIVANLIFINVEQPGLEFTVSRPDPRFRPKMNAITVGEFLRSSGAVVAINGNFFQPFHSNSPWDFYPKAGDPVEVLGIAASKGDLYSTQVWAAATLFISKENSVQLGGTVPSTGTRLPEINGCFVMATLLRKTTASVHIRAPLPRSTLRQPLLS